MATAIRSHDLNGPWSPSRVFARISRKDTCSSLGRQSLRTGHPRAATTVFPTRQREPMEMKPAQGEELSAERNLVPRTAGAPSQPARPRVPAGFSSCRVFASACWCWAVVSHDRKSQGLGLHWRVYSPLLSWVHCLTAGTVFW